MVVDRRNGLEVFAEIFWALVLLGRTTEISDPYPRISLTKSASEPPRSVSPPVGAAIDQRQRVISQGLAEKVIWVSFCGRKPATDLRVKITQPKVDELKNFNKVKLFFVGGESGR